jgi:hypothetical protein
MGRSPAYCKYRIDNPDLDDDTPAKSVGKALHMAILEPERFTREVIGKPDGMSFATKEGKAWRDDHLGMVVLTTDDWLTVQGMIASVRAHPAAAAILRQSTLREATGIWQDSTHGLTCKMRPDLVVPSVCTLADLKTSRAADPSAFPREIHTHGYYRQGAHYIDGARELGLTVDHYVIIAVQNTAPFECYVYRLSELDVEAGRIQNAVAMEEYSRCRSTGDWPAGPREVIDITMPVWATSRIFETAGEES